mmetsp:Transcript_1152/g.1148  ORF Transcript_1152/g.1148 Transcript_1152/m.1148 type:complete len:128 (+) Transcript_1152:348-731(+)
MILPSDKSTSGPNLKDICDALKDMNEECENNGQQEKIFIQNAHKNLTEKSVNQIKADPKQQIKVIGDLSSDDEEEINKDGDKNETDSQTARAEKAHRLDQTYNPSEYLEMERRESIKITQSQEYVRK